MDDRFLVGLALSHLGSIALSEAAIEDARCALTESLELFVELGDRGALSLGLNRTALMLAICGDWPPAAHLMAASEAIRAQVGIGADAYLYRKTRDSALAILRLWLPADLFVECWQRGSIMTAGKAAALALQSLGTLAF